MAGGFAWLAIAVPTTAGRVALPGLGAEVEVLRDSNAVPHIFAARMTDAYRALGFLHAQDRLLQMELNRRVGAGRMSELIGSIALPTDRLMRVLGFYSLAEQHYRSLDAATRAALDAYAKGVNAYLGSAARVLPPELVLLEGTPEPWQPADSLVWAKLMALSLSENWRGELTREIARTRLTPEQRDDIWPEVGGGRAVTLPQQRAALETEAMTRMAELLDRVLPVADASNIWAVAGGRTASGKPLLANDPHLGFTAPGLWYLARIVTPELELTGATVPGVPFHILGQNGSVAWGLTTPGSDTQDLFIERPAGPDAYQSPDGPRTFDTRTELIRVRFRDRPETLVVRSTRHGPVVSDLDAPRADGTVLALAWTALAPDDRTPQALHRMNQARSWPAFREALEDFHSPQQNVAFAATDGTIAFLTAGRTPIRKSGDGTVPVPGETGAYDWVGTIPFDGLPQVVDPPSGKIVNGNNRLVGRDFPYLIARDWADGFRAYRIEGLLDQAQGLTVEAMSAIQFDALAAEASTILPKLLAQLDGDTSAPRQAAARLLTAWDLKMDRERPEPAIYAAWLGAVWRRVTADELGELAGALAQPRAVLARMLGERDAWCDDRRTPAVETCAEQVRAGLGEALAQLTERLGSDQGKWRWGDAHQARFRHQLLGRIPIIGDAFGILVRTDGGNFTINRGTFLSDGARAFEHVHGPGYRAVYDLSDPKQSRFMIATGQSDRPFSAHYADLTPRWARGESFTLAGDAAQLKAAGARSLILAPR